VARELIWYPGDGGQIVLNDRTAGYRVHKGVTGLGVPDPEFIVDTSPLIDGEFVDDEDVYEVGRRIMLPMTVFGPDNTTFRSRMKALAGSMNPRKPGFFEVAQADGQRRRIQARYAGGLSGDEAKDLGGDTTWARFALRLYAPDPFWFDPVPVTLTRAYATPSAFFPFGPVSGRPFRLSSGAVLGDAVLTNPGDITAWPTWTATAPGTAVALDNDDTGEELHLSGTLSGDLVIVTQPGQQSITMGGVDWWDKLTGTPELWELPPGDTHVSLSLTGAAAGSSVSCSFFPRYRSAW
jgi:hypothetical protein